MTWVTVVALCFLLVAANWGPTATVHNLVAAVVGVGLAVVAGLLTQRAQKAATDQAQALADLQGLLSRTQGNLSALGTALETLRADLTRAAEQHTTNLGHLSDEVGKRFETVLGHQQEHDALLKQIATRTETTAQAVGNFSAELAKVREGVELIAQDTAEGVLAAHAAAAQSNGAVQVLTQALLRLRQAAGDIPTNREWTLEDSGVRQVFEPGRLKKVVDTANATETVFEYQEDGTVTSQVLIAGVPRYRIHSTALGAPLEGLLCGEDGTPEVRFEYDQMGQVAKRERVATKSGKAK
ncbi:MAG: hypothetical protein A3K19_29665 [Lentisphaerae bacterium RIFOXYB12_FULL_65_16]|nr:MAG: hypothetical protein A3K18_33275 [Lentisphaerae bacterium RIFOXYA12_64_32]OGV86496.1 MAG: hypothetical protein A3K19_29665 [Lentisphaerae bacterium RIFOXYB12_FULL_65_16]